MSLTWSRIRRWHVPQELWSNQQDSSFFDQAIIDADGVIVATTAQCKEVMDISCKGTGGYRLLEDIDVNVHSVDQFLVANPLSAGIASKSLQTSV